MKPKGCWCSEVYIGGNRTGAREWKSDCPKHGLNTDWYESDDQRARRENAHDRLNHANTLARIARRIKEGHTFFDHNEVPHRVGECRFCDEYREEVKP